MTKGFIDFEKVLERLFYSLKRIVSLPHITDEEKMSLFTEIVLLVDKYTSKWSSDSNLD